MVMGNRASRSRHHEAPEDVGTLWTLRRFAATARCALVYWPDSWELRVIVDGATLLSERCARPKDAFGLAESWKARLLRDGWKQILPSETRRAESERESL